MAGDGVACSNQLIKFPLLLLSWCDIGGYTEIMKLIESKEGDVMAAPSFLLPLAYSRPQQAPGVQHFAVETQILGRREEGDGWNPKSKSKQVAQLWQFPATSVPLQPPWKIRWKIRKKTTSIFLWAEKHLGPAQHQRAAVRGWWCSGSFWTWWTLFHSLHH